MKEPKYKEIFRINLASTFQVGRYIFIGYKEKATSPIYINPYNVVLMLTDTHENMVDMEGQLNFSTELIAFTHVKRLLTRELTFVDNTIRELIRRNTKC